MRTTLFHRSVLLAAALAASPLQAGILHDFNNQPIISTFDISGSTIVPSTVPGLEGNALKLTYDLTTGAFAGLSLNVEGFDRIALGMAGLRFQYRMTGPATQIEIDLIDGDSPDDKLSDKRKASFAPTVDGAWHSVTIPWGSFAVWPSSGSGSFDENNIAFFGFVVARGAGANGVGEVYLDNFEFVDGGGSVVRVLDAFSFPKSDIGYLDWSQDEDVPFPLSIETDETVPGAVVGNKVVRLGYTLASGSDYGGFVRILNANLLAEPTVRFKFKGTGGDNTLEVKLTDIDGTTYFKKLADVTDTGGAWKTASIPVEQFSYFGAGGDSVLNLRRIAEVQFAIVRGEARDGVLTLDTLETVAESALEKSGVGAVLARYATPANPFSPNGDGRKDTFTINYTLNEDARVVLRIFNLQGVPVKTVDGGNQAAGDSALNWDGLGDDGGMVSNGVYFTVFEVEGVSSGKDTVKNVVGVVR